MKVSALALTLLALTPATFAAPPSPPLSGAGGPDTGRALTIYNQNFAVVREPVRLDLKAGTNQVTFNDITSRLEPASVILRDPAGKRSLQILEQNYRADPISPARLLALYEGKTIEFQVTHGDRTELVTGRIVRSGTADSYGYGGYSGGEQPLVEVGGKLQFGLPGTPLFPALGDDSILKPTLTWALQTDKAGPLDAELAYVTDGMTWQADYNLVAPQQGDFVDLIGWITMDNQSGHTFENARIKLMAGDVNKIQNPQPMAGGFGGGYGANAAPVPPPVTEKAFDEYHLYTLQRPTTLRDRQTKQVEFVHAARVPAKTIYVYDGAASTPGEYLAYVYDRVITEANYYGVQSNKKVWVMREIVNSQANGLGIPLPKGRLRFYRRDADGQLEFTGENVIDHTPKDETLRVYTGNSFDLVGERRQTEFHYDTARPVLDESFEIKVRNHKATPTTIRVVEHLYRWINWEITAKSDAYEKKDSHTIEFPVAVAPDTEKTVTYTVRYAW